MPDEIKNAVTVVEAIVIFYFLYRLTNTPSITIGRFLKSNISCIKNRQFRCTEARPVTKTLHFCKMWDILFLSGTRLTRLQSERGVGREVGGCLVCGLAWHALVPDCSCFDTFSQSNAPSV